MRRSLAWRLRGGPRRGLSGPIEAPDHVLPVIRRRSSTYRVGSALRQGAVPAALDFALPRRLRALGAQPLLRATMTGFVFLRRYQAWPTETPSSMAR